MGMLGLGVLCPHGCYWGEFSEWSMGMVNAWDVYSVGWDRDE
jgi:hypothetical protein